MAHKIDRKRIGIYSSPSSNQQTKWIETIGAKPSRQPHTNTERVAATSAPRTNVIPFILPINTYCVALRRDSLLYSPYSSLRCVTCGAISSFSQTLSISRSSNDDGVWETKNRKEDKFDGTKPRNGDDVVYFIRCMQSAHTTHLKWVRTRDSGGNGGSRQTQWIVHTTSSHCIFIFLFFPLFFSEKFTIQVNIRCACVASYVRYPTISRFMAGHTKSWKMLSFRANGATDFLATASPFLSSLLFKARKITATFRLDTYW